MDSLNHILRRKDFDEPAEFTAIKKFVRDEFQTDISVAAHEHDLIVTVPNASLASALRMRLPELKRRTTIGDKKIIIRIG